MTDMKMNPEQFVNKNNASELIFLRFSLLLRYLIAANTLMVYILYYFKCLAKKYFIGIIILNFVSSFLTDIL